ncbi:poly(3-hydroxyalkanoate) depolymerase [Pseudonocardia sp. TRM90224]|uniref:poly(3-hydroxyalkanoate) depolymerase n=1 Tax=Pseudonocardia sp. TRM90224 TaxID=2812678 RepID=UPI001E4FA7D3|nr:poly(3-hydroxyalkanoate) depolymerase [Pseudonocardia sp. TRM90224]
MTVVPIDDDVAPSGPISRREVRIREVEVCGTAVRTAVWPGSAAHTPLLLFNGIGASFELLAPFADAVGDIEVIAFDVPGAGGSQLPKLPYRLSTLAVLVSKMLDELGFGQVDVLGVSWGGAAAQQFALQNPRRCRRLVLAATSPGVLMVPPKPAVLAALMTPRRFNDPEYRRRIAGTIYGGRAAEGSAAVDRFRRTSHRGYLLQQFALAGWSSLPWLALLRQPTLIIAGSDDPIIPLVNARILARLIRRSRLLVVDDGHLFLISAAAWTGRVVREFLVGAQPR